MNTYELIKPLLFQLDPETAHHLTLKVAGSPISKYFINSISNKKYQLKTKNLCWSFPVGIAAGLDKEAVAIDFFSHLGVGSLEVGTVTLRPQLGNDRPRIFRIKKTHSVRNSMGFPSSGSETLLKNLESSPTKSLCLGINIGKNKTTDNKDAYQDYKQLLDRFQNHGDYFTINISSPNTKGLRELQSKNYLRDFLQALELDKVKKPVYLKISPDINDEQLKNIYEVSRSSSLSGIIATNTTAQHSYGAGGVSGKELTSRSHFIYSKLLQLNADESSFDIICVGGIHHISQLVDIWSQGGKLVQIYTALIYQGPQIFHHFASSIDKALEKSHASGLQELLSDPQSLHQYFSHCK